MIIINTKVLRYITQTKALKMNGLQWLVWPWAYDQVGSLMDGWGSGAYEMRQYTHLANATISKNISYNILQILSLYFREAPFWKAIRVCGHCLFSMFNYIHVITLDFQNKIPWLKCTFAIVQYIIECVHDDAWLERWCKNCSDDLSESLQFLCQIWLDVHYFIHFV